MPYEGLLDVVFGSRKGDPHEAAVGGRVERLKSRGCVLLYNVLALRCASKKEKLVISFPSPPLLSSIFLPRFHFPPCTFANLPLFCYIFSTSVSRCFFFEYSVLLFIFSLSPSPPLSLSASPLLPSTFSLGHPHVSLLYLRFFFLISDSVSPFLFHEPCSTFVSPLLVPVSVSLFAPRFLCFFLHTHACPWHVCRISTSFPRSSVSVPLSPGFLRLFLRLVSLSSSLFFLLPAAVSFLRPIYPPRIPLSSSVPLLRRGYACV